MLVYVQDNESNFSSGNYNNTFWNGSEIVLFGDNVSGSYMSEVFDANDTSIVWNNLIYAGFSNLTFL